MCPATSVSLRLRQLCLSPDENSPTLASLPPSSQNRVVTASPLPSSVRRWIVDLGESCVSPHSSTARVGAFPRARRTVARRARALAPAPAPEAPRGPERDSSAPGLVHPISRREHTPAPLRPVDDAQRTPLRPSPPPDIARFADGWTTPPPLLVPMVPARFSRRRRRETRRAVRGFGFGRDARVRVQRRRGPVASLGTSRRGEAPNVRAGVFVVVRGARPRRARLGPGSRSGRRGPGGGRTKRRGESPNLRGRSAPIRRIRRIRRMVWVGRARRLPKVLPPRSRSSCSCDRVWRGFSTIVAEFAETVVFTAGAEGYARPLCDVIDPRGRVDARLYRDACVRTPVRDHVKDLAALGRDPRRTVLVDNNPFSFLLQPENGAPCASFVGDPEDRHLERTILPLLRNLAAEVARGGDVRPMLRRRFDMEAWFARRFRAAGIVHPSRRVAAKTIPEGTTTQTRARARRPGPGRRRRGRRRGRERGGRSTTIASTRGRREETAFAPSARTV